MQVTPVQCWGLWRRSYEKVKCFWAA